MTSQATRSRRELSAPRGAPPVRPPSTDPGWSRHDVPDGPPALGQGRSVLAWAVLVAVCATTVVSFDGLGITELALLFLLAWSAGLTLLAQRGRGGMYRASSIYLTMFGLFHGGLLIVVALRGQSAFLATADSSNIWVYDPHTPEAVRLVIIGMLCFSLAATVAPLILASRSGPDTSARRSGQDGPGQAAAGRQVLAVVGPTLLATGVLLFLVALYRTGLGAVFEGGYITFLSSAQQSPGYAYSHVLVGLGTALAVLAGGRTRIVGWSGFALYAAMAFPLGLRGEVLFPLAALLVLEARQGRRPRRATTVVAAVAVLVLIAVVRQTRVSGLGGLTSSLDAPLDSIAEMGYSLRPSVVVANWHAAGEPYQDGWTVAASPVRLLGHLLGLPDLLPSGAQLFTVEIADRAGQIGGSPVAEAFHNFGLVGVVGLMALFGLVLGRLESRSGALRHELLLAVVLIPLLVEIRNGLLPMLVQIALGLLVLVAVRLAAGPIPGLRTSPMTRR